MQDVVLRQINAHLRVDIRVRERPCAPLGVGGDEVRAARPAHERAAIGPVKAVCRRAAHTVDKFRSAQAAAREQVLARQALAAKKIVAVNGTVC